MDKFIRFFERKGFSVNLKGQIVMANGHKKSVYDVYSEFKNKQEAAGNECPVTEEEVRQYVVSQTPEGRDSDDAEFSLRKFILDYLNKFANPDNGEYKPIWRIGPGWKTIERVGYGIPVPSDISQLQTAIRAYALDNGINKGAKLEDIKCILTDMSMNASDTRLAKIARSITYSSECVEEGREMLRKLHSFWQISEDFEIFYTLVMHWMWQVKRKLLGKDTVWSLWINFFGGTAIGKTSFCNAFASPFGDYAMSTSISKLLDEERQMLKLTASYIINLDELSINNRETQYSDKESTLGRDQQATLKSLLTQTKMQTRIMGGQSQTTRRLTFSCISSANEHLYDIIYDEKTMRRYFEFECGVDKVEDFSAMDEIKKHIIEIWRSVDDSRENGYWNPSSPVWKDVESIQQKYYPTNTTTGMWIKEEGVVSCTKDDSETLELYDEYKSFCKERGHQPKSYKNWIVDIRHLVEGAAQSEHTFIKIAQKEA